MLEELHQAKENRRVATERAIKAAEARWEKHAQAMHKHSTSNAHDMPYDGEGAGKGKGTIPDPPIDLNEGVIETGKRVKDFLPDKFTPQQEEG